MEDEIRKEVRAFCGARGEEERACGTWSVFAGGNASGIGPEGERKFVERSDPGSKGRVIIVLTLCRQVTTHMWIESN